MEVEVFELISQWVMGLVIAIASIVGWGFSVERRLFKRIKTDIYYADKEACQSRYDTFKDKYTEDREGTKESLSKMDTKLEVIKKI